MKTPDKKSKAEKENETEKRVQRIIETGIRLMPRFTAAPKKRPK